MEDRKAQLHSEPCTGTTSDLMATDEAQARAAHAVLLPGNTHNQKVRCLSKAEAR